MSNCDNLMSSTLFLGSLLSSLQVLYFLNVFIQLSVTDNCPICRDANHSDFCGNILIFKADFRITFSNVKITANDDFKMVPDKITGVTLNSTLGIPDHW